MAGAEDPREVLAAVLPRLAPGESVRACLPSAQTGPSPLFLLTSWMLAEHLALVATNRRLFVLQRSFMCRRVKDVLAAVPLTEVELERWRPEKLWSTLRVRLGGERLRLHVRPEHRDDAEHLVFSCLVGPMLVPTSA